MNLPRSLALAAALLLTSTMPAATASTIAYVGTYTGGTSQGIYAYELNKTGAGEPVFKSLGLAAATPSPSFLAVDSVRHLVFAVNETDTFNGQPTGAVSAFSADPVTGKLTLINQQPSMGTAPCHLALDPTGRFLIVANYSSGSTAVFPVAADGRLGEASSVIQHHGKGVDAKRQEGPHAHCVTFDLTGRFVFICDLGLDRIIGYRLDATGKLTLAESAGGVVKPGSGPRHLAFSPDGRFAYVLNEMSATVTAFAYDPVSGRLAEKHTVPTLPADFTGPKSCAEIVVHPSGRWLYVSNRGHNSVVQFAIDQITGALTYGTAQDTGGRTPRNFALLPAAQHLVVANQDSDTLRLCRIDSASGRLQPLGDLIATPKPVCVVFMLPATK